MPLVPPAADNVPPPQRCDSLASTQALIQQQLQDRLDSARKENARWRLSLEDALRSATEDVTALKMAEASRGVAAGRDLSSEGGQREVRRMLDERDERLRREVPGQGHSLAR